MVVSNLIENDRKEYFTSCPALIGRTGIERKIDFYETLDAIGNRKK